VRLLRPEQAGVALAQHARGVLAERRRRELAVELVGLALALLEELVEANIEGLDLGGRARREPEAERAASARLDGDEVVGRRLRPGRGGIDGVLLPVDDVVI